ncbi:MAG: carbohydrate kinase family protein [Merdibacter sp.]
MEAALPQLLQEDAIHIYTQGKEGASLYRKGECITSKGHRVDVVDTTGAGDSFIGAFLYCLLKEGNGDLEEISCGQLQNHLDFANLYAAHTTTIAGALAAMADQQELEAFRHSLELDDDFDDDDDFL